MDVKLVNKKEFHIEFFGNSLNFNSMLEKFQLCIKEANSVSFKFTINERIEISTVGIFMEDIHNCISNNCELFLDTVINNSISIDDYKFESSIIKYAQIEEGK